MKHIELAADLPDRDPHGALPRSLSADRANHYFELARAGHSADQMRAEAAAANERYRTRFAWERLSDWPFENLTQLIAAARVRLEQLEKEIAERCAQQRRLVALLSPAATDHADTSRERRRRLAAPRHTSDDGIGERA